MKHTVQQELETELNRLETLSDLQLINVLDFLDHSTADTAAKLPILRRVNAIINERCGIGQ